MIHFYIKAQTSYENALKQELQKELKQEHCSYQIHAFQLPFQGTGQRNFLFLQVEDDSLVHALKEIKGKQGMSDIILICENPEILSAYASLRLLGFLFPSRWEETIRSLMPTLKEEIAGYEYAIHYCSRFLDFTLHPDRILYMESYHHDIYIHTDTVQLKVRGALKSYEIETAYFMLLQVHKSFIVNLAYVKEIQGNELLLTNGVHIPIGDAYKAHFNRGLADYAGRKTKGN